MVDESDIGCFVVANISYSKIESKSQRIIVKLRSNNRCCKYQLFKDRKQITTVATTIYNKKKPGSLRRAF